MKPLDIVISVNINHDDDIQQNKTLRLAFNFLMRVCYFKHMKQTMKLHSLCLKVVM